MNPATLLPEEAAAIRATVMTLRAMTQTPRQRFLVGMTLKVETGDLPNLEGAQSMLDEHDRKQLDRYLKRLRGVTMAYPDIARHVVRDEYNRLIAHMKRKEV